MRKKLNTLIVDDNDAFRQSLHRVLARNYPSMRVAEAADGEDALQRVAQRRQAGQRAPQGGGGVIDQVSGMHGVVLFVGVAP